MHPHNTNQKAKSTGTLQYLISAYIQYCICTDEILKGTYAFNTPIHTTQAHRNKDLKDPKDSNEDPNDSTGPEMKC